MKNHPFEFIDTRRGETFVWPEARTYPNGTLGIQLFCESEYGPEPYATATTALDAPPPPGCVWVKEWSENAGMTDMLISAGIILPGVRAIHPSGFVVVEAYQLTPEFEDFINGKA